MKYINMFFFIVFLSLYSCKNETVKIEEYDTTTWNKVIIDTLNKCCSYTQNNEIILKLVKYLDDEKDRLSVLKKIEEYQPFMIGDVIKFTETYNGLLGYRGVVCVNQNIFMFSRDADNVDQIHVENLEKGSYLYDQYDCSINEYFEMRVCCPQIRFTKFIVKMEILIKRSSLDFKLIDLELRD